MVKFISFFLFRKYIGYPSLGSGNAHGESEDTLGNVKSILSEKLQEKLGLELEPEPIQTDPTPHDFDDEMFSVVTQSSVVNHNSKDEIGRFLDDYSNLSIVKGNPFDFWREKSNSSKVLDRLASDLAAKYLTPPPTSVDVERLFSTAGDILTTERNRLCPETAEKILFLKENLPIVDYQY